MVDRKGICLFVFLVVVGACFRGGAQTGNGAIRLEKMDLSRMFSGSGAPQPVRSVTGKPMTMGGLRHELGVGTHATSEYFVALNGQGLRFSALVGVDDQTGGRGSVTFEVWLDDERVYDSGILRGGDAPKTVDVNLAGARMMDLVVTDGGDGIEMDYANWADAVIELVPGGDAKKVEAVFAHPDLTPLEIADCAPGDAPILHGPRVTGGSPGAPFLHLIGGTGAPPLRFAAEGLPEGIVLAPETGILSGVLKKEGVTLVRVSVENSHGRAERELAIVSGKGKTALTPPMGWNSWFVWAGHVDDAKVRRAADVLKESGLAAKGYQYVVIDDCWQNDRLEDGTITTDPRFPDMRALGEHIHSLGLKFGIYSSPGPGTCAGYPGSHGHEALDARTYAAWGVDFLKYDWCSYGQLVREPGREEWVKPFRLMRDALDATGRDIVFSLCQYGRGNVWEWGAEAGGQMWRTTEDGGDVWGVMSAIGFAQDGLERWSGPGRWNDPDMIQAGWLGMASRSRPTRLTPNEQITQMTLWSILAAPLMLSCDLEKLDEFTLNLLGNDEVLAVNQDPLGLQGRRCERDGRTEVWARDLHDGTLAVGLFNLGRKAETVTAHWEALGLSGRQPVRDLWKQRDMGEHADGYAVEVPRHGAVLLRVGGPRLK